MQKKKVVNIQIQHNADMTMFKMIRRKINTNNSAGKLAKTALKQKRIRWNDQQGKKHARVFLHGLYTVRK